MMKCIVSVLCVYMSERYYQSCLHFSEKQCLSLSLDLHAQFAYRVNVCFIHYWGLSAPGEEAISSPLAPIWGRGHIVKFYELE